ncbi:Asp-tRNA(Asn)/Glu-tRNA(Gln) amidotransferase subunit GatB [Tissierella sp. Yu-01]|uniref:Asp-tRNA(Asn)/Glu-tRNA(Gln) amidotransferase subunit GatB n=1 Tax=Tissierella sp. Yu-01 TaxID=3035694 RepID=UPI00240DF153|nr:Asp-tRNA(Asn)/Glu-tRNA(Gln) amidotransferase subunit GatB [Tissierella sp. Yu-01]WFA08916.1 Asp-tRNA(Asn)/Glu-tRNA(Gln) amidotransferase subunit GatB [Tissierella sp. Yu-01]
MTYKTIIGLEIHVELMTKHKIFCNCPNEFGGEANTHVCPVCLGLPGALPVLDKEALEYGIKAGIAFNGKISKLIKMDRKNYYYSDLTKGYQISQNDIPFCDGGYLEIELEDGTKKVNLERIHIEEDTGKQTHSEEGGTLLDFNRAGVPLIEVVTKPDMNSAEEARLFLDKLRTTLKYIGVSNVKMEEGSLRCDVNINVVNTETGTKSNIAEIKNLNSFKGVVKAIEFEEKRHIELLELGRNSERETRRWDETKGETIIMRKKGGASDYRFAEDGDIPPIKIADEWIEEIRNSLPELPHAKKERFINDYDLSDYDAGVLTQSKELSIFFEDTLKYIDDSKLVSNWIMGDVLRRLNDDEIEIEDSNLTPNALADLLVLIRDGKINNNTGKKVLKEMFDTEKSADTIVKEKGLIQISDEGALKEIIEKVLSENEQSIIDYKNGKDRAIGFLVGQIMKSSKGKANPQLVNKMLLELINER